MFKNGSKVRYTGKSNLSVDLQRVGKTGTIKDVRDDYATVVWDDGYYKTTAPWLSNLELIEDKSKLDRLMQEYKDARAAHVRAKEQQAAAQRGVHLFATELQKARDALLAEIDASTKPQES